MTKATTALTVAVAIGFASGADANPFFGIGDGQPVSWQDAVQNNLVVPVTNGQFTGAAEQFYADQVLGDPNLNSVVLQTSEIFPLDDVPDAGSPPTVKDSLFMQWDNTPSVPDQLNVGAFEFQYSAPADLTGKKIVVTILPPEGIWDVSLELIDSSGLSRGWFETDVETGLFRILAVHPDEAGQQDFDVFIEEPGFDITSVVAIRLDEAAMGGPFVGPTFSAPGYTTGFAWNSWDSIQVTTPVPATVTVLALGVLALGALTRRRAA